MTLAVHNSALSGSSVRELAKSTLIIKYEARFPFGKSVYANRKK